MYYSCNGEDADKYGADAAIFLHFLKYWIIKNKANGKHEHETTIIDENTGEMKTIKRTWSYNSMEALSKIFTFLTVKQIRRVISNLKKHKVLLTGNFNKMPYDRTTWYALMDEPICPNGQMEGLEQDNEKCPNETMRIAHLGRPIPFNNQFNIQLEKTSPPRRGKKNKESNMLGTKFDKTSRSDSDDISFLRPPARAFKPTSAAESAPGTNADCDAFYRWVNGGEFNQWDKMQDRDFARLIIGMWRSHGYKSLKQTYRELVNKLSKKPYVKELEDKETAVKMLIHVFDNPSLYEDHKDIKYVFDNSYDCPTNPLSVLSSTNVGVFMDIYRRVHGKKKKPAAPKEDDVINYIMSKTKISENKHRYLFHHILGRLKKAGLIADLKESLIKTPAKALAAVDPKHLKNCDELIKALGVKHV